MTLKRRVAASAAFVLAAAIALLAPSALTADEVSYERLKFSSSEGNLTVCPSKNSMTLYSPDNGKYLFDLRSGEKLFDICISKRTSSSQNKILLITGPENRKYGNALTILALDCKTGIMEESRTSMENMNPHNIQTADVDGDGSNEISITMYKSTKFHPVMDERPYIYFWNDTGIFPMWRGSRLSRPFCEYVFFDINSDDTDELISIEYLQDGKNIINAYAWKGFGFESICTTDKLDGPACFEKRAGFDKPATPVICIESKSGKSRKALVCSGGKLFLSGEL